jgi:uncharacterized membrane protein YcaP (DUF421 family)
MILTDWILAPPSDLLMVLVSAIVTYVAILLLTRMNGLQSFSKMSSFDFAITIAMGSVIASTIVMEDPPLTQGIVALGGLFGLQFIISSIRRRIPRSTSLLDNQPLLIMAGTNVISRNMDRARMSRDDLFAKLRMSGITHVDQVFAVVFETTGDVSVIRRSDRVDPAIFSGVRDFEQLEITGGKEEA